MPTRAMRDTLPLCVGFHNQPRPRKGAPTKKETMAQKNISAVIPATLYADLQKLADKRMTSVASVIRTAIADAVKADRKGKK